MRAYLTNVFIRWLMRDDPPMEFPLCDFNCIMQELKPCDVLLVEGRNRVSRIIQSITKSNWSHAALYIGRIHDLEDIALRKIVSRNLDRKDHGERLVVEGMLGQGIIVTPVKFYERDHLRICRPKGISLDDAQSVIAHCIQSIGVPYRVRHILDLARFLLPWGLLPKRYGSVLFKPRDEYDSEICSSVIAGGFQSVDFPILPDVSYDEAGDLQFQHRNSRLFAPSDFDYSPYFEIIKYSMMNIGQNTTYRKLPWSGGPGL